MFELWQFTLSGSRFRVGIAPEAEALRWRDEDQARRTVCYTLVVKQ